MKIEYQTFNFRNTTLKLIEQANKIIAEYLAEGYELTLRQLYYQFVARGYIANRENEYKKLGSIINDARLAGELDWLAIVDRTRQIKGNSHWEQPKVTDSRFASYVSICGNESWELDALDPRTINDLVKEEIQKLTEDQKRQKQIEKQESEREKLQTIADNFDDLQV